MAQNSSTNLIIYYSKSGRSRRVAENLGKRLGVRAVPVTTRRYTWPILGWIAAGRDGLRGASAPLEHAVDLPGEGTVILVGPVWVGGPAGPLNTIVDALKPGHQDVAVLLTCGDPKADTGPVSKFQQRLGRPLKAHLVLPNAIQDTPDADPLLDAFGAASLGEVSKA